MSRYEIVVYWSDEDDCYIAEVPELPGCMADGADRQEVVRNVEPTSFMSMMFCIANRSKLLSAAMYTR